MMKSGGDGDQKLQKIKFSIKFFNSIKLNFCKTPKFLTFDLLQILHSLFNETVGFCNDDGMESG